MASGGHSHLVVVKDYCEYEIIGRTRDDAAGEAFAVRIGKFKTPFSHGYLTTLGETMMAQGDDMVHYWMHNNMITINGQKMGKSYGNFINLDEFLWRTISRIVSLC